MIHQHPPQPGSSVPRFIGDFEVVDPWLAAGMVWAALNGVLVLMAHPLRQELLRTNLETMFTATLNLVVRGLKDGSREP